MADKYVGSADELRAMGAAYRRAGQRVTLTNGVFDILHRGHIDYLMKAKTFGDVLVVGLNSDASVRRLKGPTRPINSFHDRVAVLAALAFVDHVVALDADTAVNLLEILRPNTYVKGSDYTLATLPEASACERLRVKIRFAPLIHGYSTSHLITRLKEADASRSPGEQHGPL